MHRHLRAALEAAVMTLALLAAGRDGAMAQGALPYITNVVADDSGRVTVSWAMPSHHVFFAVKYNTTGATVPAGFLSGDAYRGTRGLKTSEMIGAFQPGVYYFQVMTRPANGDLGPPGCPTGIGRTPPHDYGYSGGNCYSNVAKLTLVEQAPPAAAPAPPPIAAPSAGVAAEAGGGPIAPSASSAPPAIPAPAPAPAAPPSSASTTLGAEHPVTPIAPAPAVPAPRDVSPPSNVTPPARAICMQSSTDPAFWKALGEHIDALAVPERMRANIRTCVEEYRANPWPAGGGLYRGDGTPGGDQPPPAQDRDTAPLEATLDTQEVLLHRIGEQGERPLPNAPLRDGDTIATENRRGVVTFGDGSRVEVQPNGALTLGDIRGKSLVHLRGRVFMDIKSRNWTIRVPGAKGAAMVAVRGTQFALDVDEAGDLRVEVTEGTVEVISGGVTRAVSAGSRVMTTPGEVPAAPLPLPSLAGDSPATSGLMSLRGFALLAAAAVLLNRATVRVLRSRRRAGR